MERSSSPIFQFDKSSPVSYKAGSPIFVFEHPEGSIPYYPQQEQSPYSQENGFFGTDRPAAIYQTDFFSRQGYSSKSNPPIQQQKQDNMDYV